MATSTKLRAPSKKRLLCTHTSARALDRRPFHKKSLPRETKETPCTLAYFYRPGAKTRRFFRGPADKPRVCLFLHARRTRHAVRANRTLNTAVRTTHARGRRITPHKPSVVPPNKHTDARAARHRRQQRETHRSANGGRVPPEANARERPVRPQLDPAGLVVAGAGAAPAAAVGLAAIAALGGGLRLGGGAREASAVGEVLESRSWHGHLPNRAERRQGGR